MDRDLLEKLARLALCPSAPQGEWQAAAIKLVSNLRKEGMSAEQFLALPNGKRSNYFAGIRTMPFGKYMGHRVTDIARQDPDYLKWCLSNLKQLSIHLRREMEDELKRYGY